MLFTHRDGRIRRAPRTWPPTGGRRRRCPVSQLELALDVLPVESGPHADREDVRINSAKRNHTDTCNKQSAGQVLACGMCLDGATQKKQKLEGRNAQEN